MPNLKSFFTADVYEYDNQRFRIYNEFPNEREFRESVYLDGTEYPGRLLNITRCHESNAWQVQIPDSTGAIYTLNLFTYTATNSLGQSAPLLDDDAEDTLITVPYIEEGFFLNQYINRFYVVEGNTGKLYSLYSWHCGNFSVDFPNTVYDHHSTVTVEYVRTGQYPEKLWLNETEYLEVYFDYYRDVLTPNAEPTPALNKYTVVYHDEDIEQIEVHQQGSCFDAYAIRALESGNVRRVDSITYIERNIPYELHGPVEDIYDEEADEFIHKQYYYVKYTDPETDEIIWHNTGRFALLKDDREYGEIIPDEQPDEYDRFFIRKIGSTYNAVRYRSTDFASDREAEDYINSTGRYDKFILVRLEPYLSSTLETLSNGDKVYYYYVDYLDRSYKCDEYEVYEQGGEVTPEPEPDEIDPNDPNLPPVPAEPNAPYQVKPLGDYEIFQSGSDYYAGRWNYKVYYNGAVERLNTFSAVSEALTPHLSSNYTDFPYASPRYKRYYYEVHYDDAEKDVHLSRTLDSYLDVQYFRARFYDYPDSTQLVGTTFADAGTVPALPDGFEQYKYIHGYYCTLYGFTPELSALYEDTDFKALYADAETGQMHFTVEFYQEDETTLIEAREVPVYSELGALPEAPVKRVTYSSGGKPWGYDIECRDFIDDSRWFTYNANYIITRDAKAIARYWSTSEQGAVYRTFYTVTFKDFRGNDLDFEYYQGDTPEAPAVPARIYSGDDEYEFRGWNPSTIAVVNGNAVYTSVYEKMAKPQVVIRFLDHAGSVLSIQSIEYGTTATAPQVPSYTSPASGDLSTRFNRYDFTAWNPALASRETQSHDYTAQYTSTRVYRIRFLNFASEVVQSQFLEADSTVTAPSVPQTVVSNERTYEFSAWSPAVASVSSNVDYQAVYEEVFYTVRFFDFYGNLLSTQTLYRGDEPEVPSVEQTVVQNSNVYAFTGWNPSVSAVTGDVDYLSVYEQRTFNVTIRFINSVTNEVIDTQVIAAGTAVTPPQVEDFDVEPSQSSGVYTHYTFTGWQPSIASAETESHDYSAQFSSSQTVKIEFWRVDTGAPAYDLLLKTEFVPYGGTATPPATAEPYIRQTGVATWDETVPIYSKFIYPSDIYTWSPALAQAETTSHRYQKSYDYKCQVHLIRFYGFGNQLISEDFYEANSTLTAPSVEQTITQDGKTYNFDHWSPTVPSQATASEDYTAVYVEPGTDWGSSTVDLNFTIAAYDYRYPIVLNSNVQYGSVYLDDIKEFNNYPSGTGNTKLTLNGRIAMKWGSTSGSFYWNTAQDDHCSPYMNSTAYMAINVNTGNRIIIHDDNTYSNITVINDNAETFEGVPLAPNTQLSKNSEYYDFYTIKAKGNGFILLSMQGVSLAEITISAN